VLLPKLLMMIIVVSSTGKSIPVHCVVMSTSTPSYLATDWAWMSTGGNDNCKSSAGGAGGDAGSADRSSDGKDCVDVDSYAIIPASTLFSHIVPTVLRKLGYSDDSIFNATGKWRLMQLLPPHLASVGVSCNVGPLAGWLIMKNWRPLSLNLIAASDTDTVGTILGELTTVATLKIYIRRSVRSLLALCRH
jgi:homeobox domain-containing protein